MDLIAVLGSLLRMRVNETLLCSKLGSVEVKGQEPLLLLLRILR
jgi:hypothetical protein